MKLGSFLFVCVLFLGSVRMAFASDIVLEGVETYRCISESSIGMYRMDLVGDPKKTAKVILSSFRPEQPFAVGHIQKGAMIVKGEMLSYYFGVQRKRIRSLGVRGLLFEMKALVAGSKVEVLPKKVPILCVSEKRDPEVAKRVSHLYFQFLKSKGHLDPRVPYPDFSVDTEVSKLRHEVLFQILATHGSNR